MKNTKDLPDEVVVRCYKNGATSTLFTDNTQYLAKRVHGSNFLVMDDLGTEHLMVPNDYTPLLTCKVRGTGAISGYWETICACGFFKVVG